MSEKQRKENYQPIENYGIIGNLHTTALVSLNGSIDFLPFTRYESPTVFGSLLDAEKGGKFSITPKDNHIRHKQLYIPDTAILITRILKKDGIAEIIDFMPVKKHEEDCVLIRTIKSIKGDFDFNVSCDPRFDYGRATHQLTIKNSNKAFFQQSSHQPDIRLLSTVELENREGVAEANFRLKEGEKVYFVLEAEHEERKDIEALDDFVEKSLTDTEYFWREWLSKCTYSGRWLEMIHRSAITLKLMTSFKFGSTVAAATFGLPEKIGGTRNWDYRFTWIRDAAFTMYGFLRLGFIEEAKDFLVWIEARLEGIKSGDELNVMYAVDGSTEIGEQILDHWEGYKNSSPVRVGNGAHDQFQLDIYGELIDTIFVYNSHGGPVTYEFWKHIEVLANYVCEHWNEKDYGIWEVRAQKHHLLHSRVMCWVALDRAIKVARDRGFPSPIEQWADTRDEVYKDIYNNFWSEELNAFVQYKGAKTLDAAALLIPLLHFLSPYEPRWLSTLAAIEATLVTDCLVYRYIEEHGEEFDGIAGEEGTFSVCSFWYVECLARAGKIEEARTNFEKMLGYANHLGLFAEEIGLQGEQLGNFPQAYTHLGLISAAIQLNHSLSGEDRKY